MRFKVIANSSINLRIFSAALSQRMKPVMIRKGRAQTRWEIGHFFKVGGIPIKKPFVDLLGTKNALRLIFEKIKQAVGWRIQKSLMSVPSSHGLLNKVANGANERVQNPVKR